MRSVLPTLLVQSHDGAGGWIGNWSPGIGDPSFVGWLTVAAYMYASWLCLAVFRHMRRTLGAPGEPVGYAAVLAPALLALAGRKRTLARLPVRMRLAALWLTVATLLFLLGVNKQLDLQTVVTELGRILARSEGWYERRRTVQVAFIVVVLVAGLWGLRGVVLLAKGGLAEVRGVLIGTVFLMCFVAVRASSFHHVDSLLGLRVGGFKMNWILELGGIAFIGLGAYRVIGAERRSRSPVAKARAAPSTTGPRAARDRPP